MRLTTQDQCFVNILSYRLFVDSYDFSLFRNVRQTLIWSLCPTSIFIGYMHFLRSLFCFVASNITVLRYDSSYRGSTTYARSTTAVSSYAVFQNLLKNIHLLDFQKKFTHLDEDFQKTFLPLLNTYLHHNCCVIGNMYVLIHYIVLHIKEKLQRGRVGEISLLSGVFPLPSLRYTINYTVKDECNVN